MSVAATEAMDVVDIPTLITPEQLRAALLFNSTHPQNVREALGELTIKNSAMLTDELQFLKGFTSYSGVIAS